MVVNPNNSPQAFKAEVGNTTIHYVTAGSGEPVVLLHGLGTSIYSWHRNIGPLSQRYRVIAPDLPGHGYSVNHDGRYELPSALEFLDGFLDHLDISRVNLVGSSMGGCIALRASLDLPGRVRRLVLVSSAGLGREVAYILRLPGLPGVGKRLSKPTRKKTLWSLKRLVYDHSLITDELIDECHRYRAMSGANHTTAKVLRYGVDVLGQKDRVIMLDRLGELDIPVQIVWGAQDRFIPLRHGYAALERIRNAKLHIFDRCGHWPHMEKADAFNLTVSQFLDESGVEEDAVSTTAA